MLKLVLLAAPFRVHTVNHVPQSQCICSIILCYTNSLHALLNHIHEFSLWSFLWPSTSTSFVQYVYCLSFAHVQTISAMLL